MSKDLANWKVAGAVFDTPPAWTDGNYWAPEIQTMDGTFYVYYSAKDKKTGRMCVASATSKTPMGPYEDHGTLICEDVGSIDAMAVRDDSGQRYLFWKEDGNSQKKPTPIHIQKLSPDGTRLMGEKKEVLRNDAPWEGELIEGPYVMKRGEYWYMFYSGNGCCGLKCNYAVGVARAHQLEGPWEKNPGNPVLMSNQFWKCPGHGSIVEDPQGRDVFMYHAYSSKDSVYVGRQALADVVDWDASGWPQINQGKGPSLHLDGLLGKTLENSEHYFTEDFSSEKISPLWQWPFNKKPQMKVDPKIGELVMTSPESKEFLGAVLGKPTTLGDYTARTHIHLSSSKERNSVGMTAFGEGPNALGVSYEKGHVMVWVRTQNMEKKVADVSFEAKEDLYLQVQAREGHFFQFSYSADGQKWIPVGAELDGASLPPWDLGVRIGLNVASGEGHFRSFEMKPTVASNEGTLHKSLKTSK
jgi:beta-xylosidase